MRLVNVKNLRPGLVVGRVVLDDMGRPLLNSGVQLTENYIKALQLKGFERIYVADPESAVDVPPDEDLDPETRARAFQTLHQSIKTIEKQVTALREKSFDDLKSACGSDSIRTLVSEKGPLANLKSVVDAILDEILTRRTLGGLASIRSADAEIYQHSIDVCVVSIMIGKTAGIRDHHLKPLALGSLLHDIGKVFVDPAADQRRALRQHTLLGYELLKNSDEPDLLAPHVALEHHERQDGSGEPRGLIGSNTIERNRELPPPIPTLLGEITAVANVYDNLCSGTGGKPPMSPDTALSAIRDAAGPHLNKAVVAAFFRVVPVFPRGAEILVRSGPYRNFTGIVVEVRREQLDKPLTVLTRDSHGKAIAPVELDLLKEADVVIRGKIS